MLPKGPYDSKKEEPAVLEEWLDKNLYKPEFDPATNKVLSLEEMKKDPREPWALICPPPNAYARPHIGNISGYAYMDAMARYQRMNGKKVLVLPGKDHAGLEGEGVFVREVLEKQKRRKFDMKREDFYAEMMEFFMNNIETARKDEKEIGLSADFDRDIFTLDPKIVDTVLETFVEMYKKDMIYKGIRIVNWDPKARTAVADNQIEYKDAETPFFYFKYSVGEVDEFILKVKKDFEGKNIRWEYQQNHYGKDKNDILPYFYGEIEDKRYINPADGDPLDVVGFGYSDLNPGEKIDGEVRGIVMQLNKNYNLIVKNPDLDENRFRDLLRQYFLFYAKLTAGAHPILFDEYPEDKHYTNGFVIGTVRPETIFADTAIACDPKDKRYAEFIGKEIEVEFLGKKKKLNFISDYAVDKDFGTGLLKITPAHSVEDWEIANRNKDECLPPVQVIGYDLKMNHLAGEYEGLKIKEAREKMKEDMKKHGNLVLVDEEYKNRIMIAERTKAPIEPLLSSQWYLNYDKKLEDAKSIREAAVEMVERSVSVGEEALPHLQEEGMAVVDKSVGASLPVGRHGIARPKKDKKVTIHPENMIKKFDHWMENLRDWAISRSLWWGYRLPVWYNGEIKEEINEKGQVVELIKQGKSQDGVAASKENSVVLDLVRHAESVDNAVLRVSGSQRDIELSEKGIKDAESFETEEEYDLMITSNMKRAKQTGEIINKKLNLPVVESELIREKGFGDIEGQICANVIEKYEGIDSIYQIYDQPELFSGETDSEIDERLQKFIQWVQENYSGKKILVVAHGGIKKELIGLLDEEQAKKLEGKVPENLEVNRVEVSNLKSNSADQQAVLNPKIQDESWTPLEYDNPEHLRVQRFSPDAIQFDVIRHGVTKENKEKIMQGSELDGELMAENEEHVQKIDDLGEYDFVFTSSLKRTKETLDLLIKHKKVKANNIEENPLLNERSFGRLAGRKSSEVVEEDFGGDFNAYLKELDKNDNRYGTENLEDVSKRIEKFIKELEKDEKYCGKKILIAGHGGTIRAFENVANKKSYDEIFAAPSVNNLETRTFYAEPEKSNWIQDESVLDTWFSSGQWVYATLDAFDLKDTFFPTDVLVSAHDILENWDSRMMMFTYFRENSIPFKDLYLTGLVKGTDGQKMSKSRGNVLSIDELREQYGTDAVRMAYFYQNSAGASYAITHDKMKNFKQFMNKIWNASKFVLMNAEGLTEGDVPLPPQADFDSLKHESNIKLIEHIRSVKQQITMNIDKFRFGHATYNLYQSFWHEFADIHIEAAKPHLLPEWDKEKRQPIPGTEPDPEEKKETVSVLIYVLKEYLKMLHPFIPFVTERIWKEMPKTEKDHEYLMYSEW